MVPGVVCYAFYVNLSFFLWVLRLVRESEPLRLGLTLLTGL